MPKRKSDNFEYLSKKLKKLERKINRGRHRRHESSSSSESDLSTPQNHQESESINANDDCASRYDDPQPGCSYWEPECSDVERLPASIVMKPVEPVVSADAEQLPPNAVTAELSSAQTMIEPISESNAVPQLVEASETEPSCTVQQDVQELDPDLMEILGEDPTSNKEYSSDIQKDLAIRLNHIATSGLSKENRKALKERYLVPSNCKFIKAPSLNPEIRASLIESQAKRDKGIENKQTLTSCALSSLSEAITLLLSSGHKNPELLKLLMDTARILGDIQYTDSISRRIFILSTVKKELKEQLEKTKIDEMLFGNNLSETLKSAKTIIKSGADLRPSTNHSTTSKPAKVLNRPLNYRTPPTNRRQLPQPSGGTRYARAAPATQTPRQLKRTTHNSSSKTSSHQPQTHCRR